MAPLAPLSLSHIRRCLKRSAPQRLDGSDLSPAAVALILQLHGSEPQLLFIERSRHPDDPWSGNLAFPGGRIDPGDGGARQAAERETREELGLDLQQAECLGQLDDIRGAYLPVRVSCFVYLLPPEVPCYSRLNPEVSRCFLFPLAELCNPSRQLLAVIDWNQGLRQTPAIDVLGPDQPLLWGITYRLLGQFLEKLGRPLPTPTA